MKKLLAITLSLVFALSLSSCIKKEASTESTFVNTSATSQPTNTEEKLEETPSADEPTNAAWKQFLKEYETWVDSYIELVKKYEANPSDMSILSDYTEMLSDLTEWATRADEIEKELEASPEELREYSAELIKIAEKLAEVAQ